MNGDPIVGILLAAGSASRFGGGKLLAPLEDGTSLGVRSLTNLLACVDSVVAVVRPGDQALAGALSDHGAELTVCPYAANGMGQSLAWAIRATPLAKAWVIALADMPWIEIATIERIAEALARGAELVAASYQGVRGHPVGFSRRYYGELAVLSGDEGAKSLVRGHERELQLIETDDAGISRDVDTPADLAR
ncbi:MAG TPA: nucleotidyltransferase family protein [Casimicrobiaceae bacterium]|jgi:molybdenum cofactor cytidylyltransferase|nr:nucleotidyltransferase family protein [Casimicrobiaceae bacterium]